MNKRTAGGALCAVAALSLLVTACGGDSDSDSKDKIAGAEKDGKSASPSASDAAPDENAPTFAFPEDVTVKVDADATGDKVKDRILKDNGYALQAIVLGFAKRDPGLPQLGQYLGGKALLGFSGGIDGYKKASKAVTGTFGYYDRKVTLSDKGSSATVRYCEDQSRAYDKDAKTGKAIKTKASAQDFALHTALMEKNDGTWKMTLDESKKGAAECRR